MFVTAKTSPLFSLGHILIWTVLMKVENRREQVGWDLALRLGKIKLLELTDLSHLSGFDQWGKVGFRFFSFSHLDVCIQLYSQNNQLPHK